MGKRANASRGASCGRQKVPGECSRDISKED